MRSSRSSAVTQFAGFRQLLLARRLEGARQSRVARARPRAQRRLPWRARRLPPRHLLGPRRGLERLRGFPRRLRLLDARGAPLHLRRLASARALKSAAHSLRSALGCDSHARRRWCACHPRIERDLGLLGGRSADAPTRRSRTLRTARARNVRRHAGQPAVVNSRTTRRKHRARKGRTAPGEAIGHDLERSLRRRVLSAGRRKRSRARVRHRGAWLGVGLVPLRSRGRARADLADAPREKAPYWMSLKCAKMNDDTTKNVRSLRYKRFCMSIQSKRFCLVPGSNCDLRIAQLVISELN